jgi:hypothetical protein
MPGRDQFAGTVFGTGKVEHGTGGYIYELAGAGEANGGNRRNIYAQSVGDGGCLVGAERTRGVECEIKSGVSVRI